jgi:hypothetical protein
VSIPIRNSASVSGDELTQVFPIGRNAAYEMVRRGQVETIRAGKKRKLVPTAPLRRKLGMEVA